VRRSRIEDEGVFERNARDGLALCPEPPRTGDLVSIEALERRGDFGPADLDGDRFRYPC
jgi:hypothetical protein